MSILLNAFREQTKQTKDLIQGSEMSYSVSYSTGFPNLDFANGYIQEINNKKHYELGLSDGSINMLISDSGVGKTTLATQIACNIIRNFKTSCLFIEQAEIGSNIQRMKNLSRFSDEEFNNKVIVRDAGITIESVYNRVKMIHDIKMNNYDDYSYDTGLIDLKGRPVIKLEPTIFMIDSVKMVLSEKNANSDETNNLAAAQNAKTNSEYYTKMVPLCRAANIIMILINHITTDINTGFMPKKAELTYLKQGEHIQGGKSLTYIQNNIFRLDRKSTLKLEEGFCIDGTYVNIDIVKSRTNKSNRSRCSLVFDQALGYDVDLSLFMLLKENKVFEGSGAFLKLPGSDIKFSQKKFKELLYSNEEFYNTFVSVCLNFLKNQLEEEYERIKNSNIIASGVKSPYEAMLEQLNQ